MIWQVAHEYSSKEVEKPNKLRTIWTDEKQRREESERREEYKREDQRSQKKEDADARKGGKVAKHGVFPMNCRITL